MMVEGDVAKLTDLGMAVRIDDAWRRADVSRPAPLHFAVMILRHEIPPFLSNHSVTSIRFPHNKGPVHMLVGSQHSLKFFECP
jgi:hypothetical protein